MSLAKVLGHCIDEHLVLPLKIGKRPLQLGLQVAKMLWYLTYNSNNKIKIKDVTPAAAKGTYLFRIRGGSPVAV